MEQFSLEKYLENPSRKVVTRDGREVALFGSASGNEQYPVKGMIEKNETVCTWTKTGVSYCNGNPQGDDLFFADEELTEFERELEMMMVSFSNGKLGSDVIKEMPKQKLHNYANRLLDLARKEIEEGAVEFAKSYMEDVNPSFEKVQESEELWKWKMSCLKGVNKAYTNGKQDVLKDLPKWKKITEAKQNYLAYGYLSHDGYYLSIQELKDKLPKEE